MDKNDKSLAVSSKIYFFLLEDYWKLEKKVFEKESDNPQNTAFEIFFKMWKRRIFVYYSRVLGISTAFDIHDASDNVCISDLMEKY